MSIYETAQQLKAEIRKQLPPPSIGPCVLCGAATDWRAVFTPFDQSGWGMHGRGVRSIVYPLCPEHEPTEDVLRETGEILWSTFGARFND